MCQTVIMFHVIMCRYIWKIVWHILNKHFLMNNRYEQQRR